MFDRLIQKLSLTGNRLKMLALVTMTLDHIGSRLFPQIRLLRILGRLALPIFAYMIAEGCLYTKNKKKYLGLIAALALLCQIVYFVFDHSLYMCILVTFTCSISLIFAIANAETKQTPSAFLLAVSVFGAVVFFVEGIPFLFPTAGFHVDYGIIGVLLPVLIYLMPTRQSKWFGAAIGLLFLAMRSASVQWWSLLALIPLALYNGKRGKKGMKYLFYVYYPLHLAVLEGIAMLMEAVG